MERPDHVQTVRVGEEPELRAGPGVETSPSADSRTQSPEDDGLLGGSTGGLLRPPASPTGTPPAPADGQAPTEMPDVTIPPILPGLLPGLGIDSEDAR
ncbi:hypothetical protein ACWCQ0_52880 [Streptomyces massasporeus]